jgi:uncharacterized membrane protein
VPLAQPDDRGLRAGGLIDLSDPANVESNKELINTVVVVQKRMPFNNETNMTQEERDLVASWAESG